ncbi:MAG: hypothetical protein HY951_17615 [Bacteroidia bacterium]|nr:hypothetical protein [Bacteroidia bacterium]
MKKIFIVLIITLLAFGHNLFAQKDTIPQDDLLGSLTLDSTIQQQLLPDKMIFTQRILWGKKGLMRNFNAFELTPEKRAKELKLRRTMLVTHQMLGALTSLGMIGQGIVGTKLINGDQNIKDLHEGLAAGVNIAYFTTASLSLFAPPKMLSERKGYSSIKVHKYLAMVHLAGMIATNILAEQAEGNPQMQKWHRAAAFTAFGAFLAAEIVIKF